MQRRRPTNKRRANKRKGPRELESAIREKRRHVLQKGQQADRLERELEAKLKELDKCQGAEQILRYKVLKKQIAELQTQLQLAQSNESEKKMHEYMAMVDQLERQQGQPDGRRVTKEVSMDNRLHPPKPSRRNLFDMMSRRDADKWKLLRAHKKRYAVMFDKAQLPARVNSIDVCSKCGVDLNVDKETATSVCPKCGETHKFASHIFDTKDTEKDDTHTTRQQSLSHMQKFSSQFERGYPCTPIDVLEPVAVAYSKIHLHDPSKVQSCRTNHLLKGLKDIPKVFKRAPDRMTKELKRESIPEYSSTQISQLLNQRNRLRTPDEMGDDKKHKKSFSNQIYMRQLGRANQMEQSRLFPHAKTTKIHMERTRAMERECEIQKDKLGDQPGMQWSLYPST